MGYLLKQMMAGEAIQTGRWNSQAPLRCNTPKADVSSSVLFARGMQTLHERTGATLLICKRVLAEHDGNLSAALQFIKDHPEAVAGGAQLA